MYTKADPAVIELGDCPILAQGDRQHVYLHPHDPTALIKMSKPETFDAQGNLHDDGFFRRHFRRATVFRDFLREMHEYLDLKARHPQPGVLLPIAQVRGIVQTDLGVGLVYEKICEPDGTLSPSLEHLIGSGKLNWRHVEALEDHFATLIREHVVISNKNPANIVYQTREDGSARFIWIDSFGSKEFIPFRRWLGWRNAQKLREIRARFYSAIKKHYGSIPAGTATSSKGRSPAGGTFAHPAE